MAGVQAGHQGAPRRGADRAAGVALGKPPPFGCQAIEVGGLDALLPEAAEIAIAQVVGQNEHDVRPASGRRAGLCRQSCGSQDQRRRRGGYEHPPSIANHAPHRTVSRRAQPLATHQIRFSVRRNPDRQPCRSIYTLIIAVGFAVVQNRLVVSPGRHTRFAKAAFQPSIWRPGSDNLLETELTQPGERWIAGHTFIQLTEGLQGDAPRYWDSWSGDSPPGSGSRARSDALQTVAERSDYRATARYDDVAAWCREFARATPNAHLTELGRSSEGRSIPLLIVADPPVKTAAAAASSGKLVCLIIGNIHAGEVCGKEALPMLLRDVFGDPHPPLLKDLILAVAPIYNADGNERVSKTNRPGQVGPEEGMGQRANARGLDLNRDFIKLEAPETRALVRFYERVEPPSLYRYAHDRWLIPPVYRSPMTAPRTRPAILGIMAFMRETFFPELSASFEKADWPEGVLLRQFQP